MLIINYKIIKFKYKIIKFKYKLNLNLNIK